MTLLRVLRQGISGYARHELFPVVLLSLAFAVSLASCSVSVSGESGWNFWSRGGLHKTVAGFSTESEYKTIQLGAGDTLVVDYDVEVNRGSLELLVSYPVISGGGSIWSRNFDADDSGEASVKIPHSGPYEIRVRLSRFGGEYHVTWETE